MSDVKNYISAVHDWNTDQIMVWERPVEGGPRTLRLLPAPRYFYVPDEQGEYNTITGERVKKLVFDTKEEAQAAEKKYPLRFESDIKPLARALMDEYYDVPTPVVHYAFVDIEVDYSSKLGFSSPDNPYAPINAVTVYQSWRNEYVTIVVLPKGLNVPDDALFKKLDDVWKEYELKFTQNVMIARNERELLAGLIDCIGDADIISGWNSEFFDLPYIARRIERVLGKKALSALSFVGAPAPKERKVNRFGSEETVFSLGGRTHLDYLDLFKKFTFEGRTSYSLANIAAEELDVPKIEYGGTLEQLYKGEYFPPVEGISWEEAERTENIMDRLNLCRSLLKNEVHRRTNGNGAGKDKALAVLTLAEVKQKLEVIDAETRLHSFCLFVCYNARDVEVLVNLDDKFKFMQLVNQMAHENTVPFEAILGTVRYVETGIINRAHNVHKLIVNDKVIPTEENEKVEGAIVMTPRAGLHSWVGAVDLTSLYPSGIRALNMSRETFVGQFADEEQAWEQIVLKSDAELLFTYENGDEEVATAAEWHRIIFSSNQLAISAFGTVFDQTKPGMVADTLSFWFSERKRLQAEKKKYAKLADSETDPEKKLEYEKLADHYDLLQLTKKIQLNSTYGALLNEAFRFGRREIGASTTGTGRQITKHMGQTIGEILTGQKCTFEKRFAEQAGSSFVSGETYAKLLQDGNFGALRNLPTEPSFITKWSAEKGKEVNVYAGAVWFTECQAIIYGDTDSCYFVTGATNYDDAVLIADETARLVNESFPEFMKRSFNCSGGRENVISAAREIVGERALFQLAKKKYSIRVVNLEGKDLRDNPKLKSMGSEIKKADTPKAVQNFLKGLMDMILTGKSYHALEEYVNEQRKSLVFRNQDLISLGVAKQVNNLDSLYAEWTKLEKSGKGKVNLPGHVRASINYNEMVKLTGDNTSKLLKSGDKAIIFYIKPNNQFKFKSIAFPADIMHFPEWFDEHFQIDTRLTCDKMVDNKIEGIFEAMRLQVPTPQTTYLNSVFTF